MELAKLKITLVAGTLGQGGAERQLFHVIRALHGAGAAVRLLSLTSGEFWQERIEALGVPVTYVGENPSRGVRLRRIIAELKAFRPDVVQSFHFYTNFYTAVAGRVAGIADIGALRNDGLSEMRAYGPVLGRIGLRWPRILAANSRAGIENARRLGARPDRLYFLPNVIDTAHFCPAEGCGVSDEVWTLVAVGRLWPQKRFDRLICTVAELRKLSDAPFRVRILGDGPLRGELEALAAGQGVADVIDFAGAVSDTLPYLQRSDAAILTSDWEGTPNVLLEAQSCGLPVVATDAGGVREVMRDGLTGTLVPLAADEEETRLQLARAVLALREDEERRAHRGRGARAFVKEHHSMARLPVFLEELYSVALRR